MTRPGWPEGSGASGKPRHERRAPSIIPTEEQCRALLTEYRFPRGAWPHVETVAKIAVFLAEELGRAERPVDVGLVRAAALLHDLGKSPGVPRDVDHAAASARILIEHGYPELGEVVRRHLLEAVLDPERSPRNTEEKLVYYADKLVAHRYVGLEARFADLKRRYPKNVSTIERCRPTVEAMERELFRGLPFSPGDVPRWCGLSERD